jgi:hemoglobin-like flavoprotein
MKRKLDDAEAEICSVKKERDAGKALVNETNQKLEESSTALQESEAKVAKLDSDLTGMHDVVHRMGNEHAKQIQQIHKENEDQVKKCLQGLTAEREKHESTPAFQTAVNKQPNAAVGSIADSRVDTVHDDDGANSQEDFNDDPQADEHAQVFPGAQAVYSRKSRKQQQQQQQQQQQRRQQEQLSKSQQQPKSILRVGSRVQIDESDEEESGVETAIEQYSTYFTRVVSSLLSYPSLH